MYIYKDYNYVKYIYEEIPIEEALDIYFICCEQINEDRLWDLFKQGRFEGSFEEYKKKQKALSKNRNMKEVEEIQIKMKSDELRESLKNKKGTVVNIQGLK